MTKAYSLTDLAINGGPKARTKPYPPRRLLGVEEKNAIIDLLDACMTAGEMPGYNGEQEDGYCREFSEFLGGGYADGVNSGSTAVFVALHSLGIEPFSEVIVSPVTDPGGCMPIPLLNCIPVIADAAPGSYNTDAEQIEKRISPRTRAIVVAHIAGEPVDMVSVMALARSHGLPVVEDCAQAHGAKLGGQYVGTFGDVAAFSTMFGKHHTTGGQGGVVFTKDERLYWKIRRAADRGKPFGLPETPTNVSASLNFNMDEIAATIGRQQLKKLAGIVQRRREFVAKLSGRLSRLATVTIPALPAGAEASYWFWRLEANVENLSCGKLDYCKALQAEGMPVNPSYKAMPHRYRWYEDRQVFGAPGFPWTAPQYKGNPDQVFDCPNADHATDVQFNLSVSESFGDEEVEDMALAFEKVDAVYRK